MQLRLLNHPNFKDTGGGGYGPLLFWLLAVFAIACFWTTPRLPFVDLPQHAAQISMLRDMMQGHFLWGEIAQLDLWTCYLIGYVPSALLALILPVTTAIKVVLSLAAMALYWMCLNFRRYYQAPAILDYLFIPILFGTTLQWGMITFFIAAPLGLCFILLADLYARTPTHKLGVGLLLLGALVMQAHILTFLFTGLIGGGLLLIHNPSISRLLRWCWPYLGFLGYVLLYMQSSRGDVEVTYGSRIVMDIMALRLWLLPRAPFDGDLREPYWWALFIPYFLPFIAGLRPGWKVTGAWVPLVFFLIVWMTSPSTFFGTYGVYARFSIFLLPFYVVIFREHLAIGAGQRRCAVLLMAAFAVMYTGI